MCIEHFETTVGRIEENYRTIITLKSCYSYRKNAFVTIILQSFRNI